MKKKIIIIINIILIISAISFIALSLDSRKKANTHNVIIRDKHHFICVMNKNNIEYKYDINTDNDYLITDIHFIETFTYSTDTEYELAKKDNSNYSSEKEVSYKKKNKQIIYTTIIDVFGDETYPSTPYEKYKDESIPKGYRCEEVL